MPVFCNLFCNQHFLSMNTWMNNWMKQAALVIANNCNKNNKKATLYFAFGILFIKFRYIKVVPIFIP